MEEQTIRAALEKLRAQKLRRVDLHQLLNSMDQGMDDLELAEQYNIDLEDVQLMRRVLRE
ncbi:MAG: hypothetical protein FH749_05715 [Firmicutes bacterium]|nr:hypothetical protein [Bacillota bacterium]